MEDGGSSRSWTTVQTGGTFALTLARAGNLPRTPVRAPVNLCYGGSGGSRGHRHASAHSCSPVDEDEASLRTAKARMVRGGRMLTLRAREDRRDARSFGCTSGARTAIVACLAQVQGPRVGEIITVRVRVG